VLTPNQLLLLGAVVHHTGTPPTTEALAAMKNESDQPFGENAARNCMSRLESRGFVAGSGRGRLKSWTPTPTGAAAYSEMVPTSPEPEPEPETGVEEKGPRTYVVLEQCSLADAVREALPDDYAVADSLYEALNGKTVYDKVASPAARNTEHALRQTAKAVYHDSAEDPTLVAVASKMWKPTPVRLNNRQTVSIV